MVTPIAHDEECNAGSELPQLLYLGLKDGGMALDTITITLQHLILSLQ